MVFLCFCIKKTRLFVHVSSTPEFLVSDITFCHGIEYRIRICLARLKTRLFGLWKSENSGVNPLSTKKKWVRWSVFLCFFQKKPNCSKYLSSTPKFLVSDITFCRGTEFRIRICLARLKHSFSDFESPKIQVWTLSAPKVADFQSPKMRV